MTVSLLAIASIMVLGWLFGIVCDRLITRWSQGHTEPDNETEKRSCDTCRYGKVRPQDEPCCDCLQDDDIDRWEAKI